MIVVPSQKELLRERVNESEAPRRMSFRDLEIRCPRCTALLHEACFSINGDASIDLVMPDEEQSAEDADGTLWIHCWACSWSADAGVTGTINVSVLPVDKNILDAYIASRVEDDPLAGRIEHRITEPATVRRTFLTT